MELPNEIINYIMRYNSHPNSDIIKNWVKKREVKKDYFCCLKYSRRVLGADARTSMIRPQQDYDKLWYNLWVNKLDPNPENSCEFPNEYIHFMGPFDL